jgi:hypothetical protein
MVAKDGETATLASAGGPTVSNVDPLAEPELAVMVDVPCSSVLATPLAEIVATDWSDEFQTTNCVTSCCCVPNVPVAVNGCVNPSATSGFDGETEMPVSPTFNAAFARIPVAESVAVILVDPDDPPVATAVCAPVAVTLATAVFDDFHVTDKLAGWPLLSTPLAVNDCPTFA